MADSSRGEVRQERELLLAQATSAHRNGQHAEADKLYRRILDIEPNHFDAVHRLGVLKLHEGTHEQAKELLEKAVGLQPGSAAAQSNLGSALLKVGQLDAALARFDIAAALEPDDLDYPFNRANALLLLKRYSEALDCLDLLAKRQPRDPEIHGQRAATLGKLERYDEALSAFDTAIAVAPNHVPSLFNRGSVLLKLKRYDEAIAAHRAVLAARPGHSEALALLAHATALICSWVDTAEFIEQLRASIDSGSFAGDCFAVLSMFDDPVLQRKAAEGQSAKVGSWRPPTRSNIIGGRKRLRIGYLSSDFRAHAVAFLISGLIEGHDRSFCEVYGFSASGDDGSPPRKRLESAFDTFVDVTKLPDDALRREIRDAEIDILIDLGGYTKDSRFSALAGRPAPIQISYLGYPGSAGVPFIDYIIADAFVIPRDLVQHYSEKVVHLPDCFQANDRKRLIAPVVPSRAQCGLPEGGFVFCAFHSAYKLNPTVFDVWMRLLQAVPGSVIWLVAETAARENLRGAAQARGVDPARLVFAEVERYPDHLARQKLADLFIDAWPYNGGTSVSDALWVGLPVLTFAGRSYAARMAGSLLQSVGLPELITYSPEAYETLALRLATEPGLLRGIGRKLAANIDTAPLFDTARFRKHIEAAYRQMWDQHLQGKPPASFTVQAVH